MDISYFIFLKNIQLKGYTEQIVVDDTIIWIDHTAMCIKLQ